MFTIILITMLSTLRGQVVIKNGTGPHGGILNVEQGYKIEMINLAGSIIVYLFDKDLGIVSNKDIRAEIMFMYGDNAALNKTLVACEKNGFITEVANQYYFYSIVTFNISGKMITSKFENQSGFAEEEKKLKKIINE